MKTIQDGSWFVPKNKMAAMTVYDAAVENQDWDRWFFTDWTSPSFAFRDRALIANSRFKATL